MTYQNAIEEVWDTLGRPTNWPIYDDSTDPTTFNWTLSGTERILRYFRSAEVELATAINKRGRIFKWNHLVKEDYFKLQHIYDGNGIGSASNQEDPPTTTTYTDSFGNVPKGTLTVLTGASTTADVINTFLDSYVLNGYVLEITGGTGSGQRRLIIDSEVVAGATVCAFNVDWDTLPDSTSTYKLYRNWIGFNEATCSYSGFVLDAGQIQEYLDNLPLNTVTEIDTVMSIVNTKTGEQLEKGFFGDDYTDSILSTATTPTSFYLKGNKIFFDTLVDPDITFKFTYYAKPRVFTAATDSADTSLNRPDFPEHWHSALIDKVLEKGMKARTELDMAQYFEREYNNKLQELHFDDVLSESETGTNTLEVDSGY